MTSSLSAACHERTQQEGCMYSQEAGSLEPGPASTLLSGFQPLSCEKSMSTVRATPRVARADEYRGPGPGCRAPVSPAVLSEGQGPSSPISQLRSLGLLHAQVTQLKGGAGTPTQAPRPQPPVLPSCLYSASQGQTASPLFRAAYTRVRATGAVTGPRLSVTKAKHSSDPET